MNLPKRKMRLGDILKAQGLVDDQQLQAAGIQQKTKQRLGDILTETGVTTERRSQRASLAARNRCDRAAGNQDTAQVITLVSGSI
jgi:hypothetical protein